MTLRKERLARIRKLRAEGVQTTPRKIQIGESQLDRSRDKRDVRLTLNPATKRMVIITDAGRLVPLYVTPRISIPIREVTTYSIPTVKVRSYDRVVRVTEQDRERGLERMARLRGKSDFKMFKEPLTGRLLVTRPVKRSVGMRETVSIQPTLAQFNGTHKDRAETLDFAAREEFRESAALARSIPLLPEADRPAAIENVIMKTLTSKLLAKAAKEEEER